MTITKVQIGRALGFLILIALLLGTSYLVSAFISWDINAAHWSPMQRIGTIGIVVLLVVGRLFSSRIKVIDGDEEPEQR